ncbi:MAG: DNA alkylation repair protein [Acidobacteriia bacterium]|nr:DNA alkylation repair protein [Terriglobia bacterium]
MAASFSSPLIRVLKQSLRAAADPAKAPGMQAYIKSKMPYLGVSTPVLRETIRPIFAAHVLESFEAWRGTILELWRKARYREEWYAAIELAGYKPYDEFRTQLALPVYEEMIVSGAWWDVVDAVATKQLGILLRKQPRAMAAILRKWAVSDNIWKRRSAIISQLNFKNQTDLKLLYDCIAPSMGSSEFFLRKGIGWALRQYARTDSAEVVRYVLAHESKLSPLTKREALKHCGVQSSKLR